MCQIDDTMPHDAPGDTPVDMPIDAPPLPCTTAGLTCGTGPTTFMCGATCFAKCGATVTQPAAQTRCQGWSGHLAEIFDATTNACVASHVGTASWIGLTQALTGMTPAADWSWNNTIPLSYTNWAAGKPDDADGNENHQEQCGNINPNGTWDDTECNAVALPFFCSR